MVPLPGARLGHGRATGLLCGAVQSMSPDPPVSVVISVYNGAATLAATLDSVLAQEGVALRLCQMIALNCSCRISGLFVS
jgi:hypothetical protein